MAPSQFELFIEALNSFAASSDETDNVDRLYQLFEGFREFPERERAVPAMFALLERFPEAEFGNPGPLVREIEATTYDPSLLRESLHRQPTYLTVWMVNRLLNAKPPQNVREMWLSELHAAKVHPKSPEWVREEAGEFLEHQARAT